MDNHPLPWKVKFNQRFPEWDKQSCPNVADANGKIVCHLSMNVFHPGLPDPQRLDLANFIVEKANRT